MRGVDHDLGVVKVEVDQILQFSYVHQFISILIFANLLLWGRYLWVANTPTASGCRLDEHLYEQHILTKLVVHFQHFADTNRLVEASSRFNSYEYAGHSGRLVPTYMSVYQQDIQLNIEYLLISPPQQQVHEY